MIKELMLFGLTIVLSGCSIWGDELVTPQLFVNITAASNINPNVEGIPSPVEIRIYQLTDSSAFEQADFIQIYNDEQGVLKAELLRSRQLQSVMPGDERKETLPFGTGVKYIGIIAGFADYREAKNKVIYKTLVENTAVINIELDGINLSISGGEKDNG